MTDYRAVAVGTPAAFRHQVARALQLDPEAVDWVSTVAAGEELVASSRGSVALAVLAPSVKDPDALGMAEFAARTSPATAVIVVRDRAPDGFLTPAMRAGVRDVVDLSRGIEELEEALRRAVQWSMKVRTGSGNGAEAPRRRGKVISIFSSKGGTGKTSLATNLALSLGAEAGEDVALLDLDLQMGDVFAHFGKEATKGLQHLTSLGDDADREAVLEAGTMLAEGVRGYGVPSDPAAEAPSGEAIGKVLRGLRSQFPYIVVDTGGGYADPVLAALDVSDTVCLITGLDVVSVRHLSVALDTLLSLGLPRERFLFVLNRADSKVGLDVTEVERVMELNVHARIPSSRLVPTSLNKGRPVALEAPRSPVSQSVIALARLIQNGEAAPAKKHRLFTRG
ncbi:MAG TPA: P-loop NTPase [Actinomycetota bacterium]|nr:P-loop NTPase [Actinomycetota bacterium]